MPNDELVAEALHRVAKELCEGLYDPTQALSDRRLAQEVGGRCLAAMMSRGSSDPEATAKIAVRATKAFLTEIKDVR